MTKPIEFDTTAPLSYPRRMERCKTADEGRDIIKAFEDEEDEGDE